MMRYCTVHRGYMPDHEAVILRETITGSGPGIIIYACHPCVRDNGLVPVRTRTAPSPASTP